MYDTFNTTKIPDILIKETKDVSNNFVMKAKRVFEPKKLNLLIDETNIGKLRCYINDIYIPMQLNKAGVVVGDKDQMIQNIEVEYCFHTKHGLISYIYPQLLTLIPELYEGELPLKREQKVLLEIIFHIRVEVEKVKRKMIFWTKHELIKVCDNNLIVYKEMV